MTAYHLIQMYAVTSQLIVEILCIAYVFKMLKVQFPYNEFIHRRYQFYKEAFEITQKFFNKHPTLLKIAKLLLPPLLIGGLLVGFMLKDTNYFNHNL